VDVSLLLNALRVWQIYRLPGDDSVLPVLPAVGGVLILVAVALRMRQAGSRLPGTARGQGPVAGGSQDDDRFWKAGLI